MVRGIGTDITRISEMKRLLEETGFGDSFSNSCFTVREQKEAPAQPAFRKFEYFAGRFAAKEAVFKAICAGLPAGDKGFDLRRIEVLKDGDGRPYVNPTPEISAACERASIARIHLSISHDGDYAVAFAVAE